MNIFLMLDLVLGLLDKHEFFNVVATVVTNYINYQLYLKVNKLAGKSTRKLKKTLKKLLFVGIGLGLVYGYFTVDFIGELLNF